jgi:hypothetical protein
VRFTDPLGLDILPRDTLTQIALSMYERSPAGGPIVKQLRDDKCIKWIVETVDSKSGKVTPKGDTVVAETDAGPDFRKDLCECRDLKRKKGIQQPYTVITTTIYLGERSKAPINRGDPTNPSWEYPSTLAVWVGTRLAHESWHAVTLTAHYEGLHDGGYAFGDIFQRWILGLGEKGP